MYIMEGYHCQTVKKQTKVLKTTRAYIRLSKCSIYKLLTRAATFMQFVNFT